MNVSDKSLNMVRYNKICRLCLMSGSELLSVFEDETMPSRIMTIAPKVKIQLGDGLPSTICQNCVLLVNMSFRFRVQCEVAHESLEKHRRNPTVNLIREVDEIKETEDVRALLKYFKSSFELREDPQVLTISDTENCPRVWSASISCRNLKYNDVLTKELIRLLSRNISVPEFFYNDRIAIPTMTMTLYIPLYKFMIGQNCRHIPIIDLSEDDEPQFPAIDLTEDDDMQRVERFPHGRLSAGGSQNAPIGQILDDADADNRSLERNKKIAVNMTGNEVPIKKTQNVARNKTLTRTAIRNETFILDQSTTRTQVNLKENKNMTHTNVRSIVKKTLDNARSRVSIKRRLFARKLRYLKGKEVNTILRNQYNEKSENSAQTSKKNDQNMASNITDRQISIKENQNTAKRSELNQGSDHTIIPNKTKTTNENQISLRSHVNMKKNQEITETSISKSVVEQSIRDQVNIERQQESAYKFVGCQDLGKEGEDTIIREVLHYCLPRNGCTNSEIAIFRDPTDVENALASTSNSTETSTDIVQTNEHCTRYYFSGNVTFAKERAGEEGTSCDKTDDGNVPKPPPKSCLKRRTDDVVPSTTLPKKVRFEESTNEEEVIKNFIEEFVQCQKCIDTYDSKWDFLEHMKEHDNREIICIKCNIKLDDADSLAEHLAQCHQSVQQKSDATETKGHNCEKCHKQFTRKTELTKHKMTCHLSCEFCNQNFLNSYELLKHISLHYPYNVENE